MNPDPEAMLKSLVFLAHKRGVTKGIQLSRNEVRALVELAQVSDKDMFKDLADGRYPGIRTLANLEESVARGEFDTYAANIGSHLTAYTTEYLSTFFTEPEEDVPAPAAASAAKKSKGVAAEGSSPAAPGDTGGRS